MGNKTGLVLALLSVCLISSFAGAQEYPAGAQELLDREQYKQAIRLLDKAAQSAPEDIRRQEVLMQQAEVYYYYLEDYRQALAVYKKAYEAAPKSAAGADILYKRGLILMDKLDDKDAAVKEFEIVLEEFPQYHKMAELKRLLKGTLSRAYKMDLIDRKNYLKFFLCLIDGIIIFFWKVLHEYLSTTKTRKIILDVLVTLLVIANVTLWWIVIHAEAQLDMLNLGIIK